MAGKRITVKWLKHHMTYSWWKYLAVVVVSVLGVNMLFTMTEYRTPEEKKIELYVLNSYIMSEPLQSEISRLFFARCPDQEELTVANINLSGDDPYTRMQFTTYIAAKQGDVCLMPRSEMLKLADGGAEHAFVELSGYVENGVIDVKDIDLSRGMLRSEAGEEGLYAIPADTLYGLLAYENDPKGSYLVLMAYGGNDDHGAQVIDLMIERYHGEKPDDYDKLTTKKTNSATYF